MTEEIKLTNWVERLQNVNLFEKTECQLHEIIYYQSERLDSYEKTLKNILNKTQKALK